MVLIWNIITPRNQSFLTVPHNWASSSKSTSETMIFLKKKKKRLLWKILWVPWPAGHLALVQWVSMCSWTHLRAVLCELVITSKSLAPFCVFHRMSSSEKNKSSAGQGTPRCPGSEICPLQCHAALNVLKDLVTHELCWDFQMRPV